MTMKKQKKGTEAEIVKHPRWSDLGTPETQRQGGGVDISENEHHQPVATVRTQIPLDYYYNRGYLEESQYQAACKLQDDFRLAGLGVVIKSSLNYEQTGGKPDLRLIEKQIDAKDRFNEIIYRELRGPERAIIMWVVLDDGYLKDFKGLGLVTSATAQSLADALDLVTNYYDKWDKRK